MNADIVVALLCLVACLPLAATLLEPVEPAHKEPWIPTDGMDYEAVADPNELPVAREARTVVTRRDDLREFFWQ